MGNNILRKYREDNKLKALTAVEDLTKSTISVLNNDNYFPKRQKYLFAQHISNNVLDAYETLRYANRLYPESKALIHQRYECVIEAERKVSSVVSDINMMPTLIRPEITDEKWFKNLQEQAIETDKLIKNYRISETKRFHKDLSEFNDNCKKKKLLKNTKDAFKAVS